MDKRLAQSRLGATFLALSFLVVALVCHTAFWLHSTIYDNQKFTTVATSAIMLESSRQSIGSQVVDQALSDRPIARRVVGERLSHLIAGLLGTDLAANAVQATIERAHLLVTSSHPDSITFDTTAIKQQIVALRAATGRVDSETRVDTNKIPDEITIIDSSKLPNLYAYGIAVFWVGSLATILLVGTSLYYIFRPRDMFTRLIRFQHIAVLMIVSSLIALLVGPLVRPVFLTMAQNAPEQTLLRNLFDGFIAPFNTQAIAVGIMAVVILAATLVLRYRIWPNQLIVNHSRHHVNTQKPTRLVRTKRSRDKNS